MKSKAMRIAGGVLALVASVGGTIAGFITIFFGAVGKVAGDYAVEHGSVTGTEYAQAGQLADQSVTLMRLGWLGILIESVSPRTASSSKLTAMFTSVFFSFGTWYSRRRIQSRA
jgi:hypothetical protein